MKRYPRISLVVPVNLCRFCAVSILLLFAAPGVVEGQTNQELKPPTAQDSDAWLDVSDAEKQFVLVVQPLLQKKCAGCHGEKRDDIQGGFDVTSREQFLRGGDNFGTEVVQPGKATQSVLVRILAREEDDYAMPPKESEKLTRQEIEAVRTWINGGLPWPDEDRRKEIYRRFAEGIPWETSGGLAAQWTQRKYKPENLWAYRPLKKFDQNQMAEILARKVDFFVDRKLESAGISPAPAAPRATLVRRMSFDLLGLPPDPEEIRRVVNDPRDDDSVLADLVDRLLDSPHYGEHWGRHWLDVARYADSSGFANDWERPNAWRYRDYVIRAFNEDKPYDQFIREQIAGDELAELLDDPDPERNPRAAELLIATGFLRMGPWEHTSMSVAQVTRQQFLDDVTDAVGQVFLAHPLQCCRCHDHKFDPVPTRDYYSIQAVFATTQFAEPETCWLGSENRSGIQEDREILERKIAANERLKRQMNQRIAGYARNWFRKHGLPYETVQAARNAGVPADKLPPPKYGWTADDYGQQRVVGKWAKRFEMERDRYRPYAFSVYDGKTVVLNSNQGRIPRPTNPEKKGYWQNTSILIGGKISSPGERVQPGVLSACKLPAEIPDKHYGRRLAFSNWLVNEKNPLVARVMVNRIWQYHFGKAIAGNPNNFGATGKKPTHPELLDWLAAEFIRSGWSVKHMHRLILNSRVYRRRSRHPDDSVGDSLKRQDPENQLLAVFPLRQLTAEELRDSMLVVSGELNREIGGIPVRPDMNLEAALQPRMIMGTFAPAYVPNANPDRRNRRSIYALQWRGQRDPMMELFNQPGPDKSCERRDESLIAPQALTLLNGEETNDRALAFAVRLEKEAPDRTQTIVHAFELAFGRQPTSGEIELTLDFWERMTKVESEKKYQPRKWPIKVTRSANEENTGKIFSFVEELVEYRDYRPDPQPENFSPRTRGLAAVCLALLNSNEFQFVD